MTFNLIISLVNWPVNVTVAAVTSGTPVCVTCRTFSLTLVSLQTPHLVNLNEDPLMSECLLYYIKDGITRYEITSITVRSFLAVCMLHWGWLLHIQPVKGPTKDMMPFTALMLGFPHEFVYFSSCKHTHATCCFAPCYSAVMSLFW